METYCSLKRVVGGSVGDDLSNSAVSADTQRQDASSSASVPRAATPAPPLDQARLTFTNRRDRAFRQSTPKFRNVLLAWTRPGTWSGPGRPSRRSAAALSCSAQPGPTAGRPDHVDSPSADRLVGSGSSIGQPASRATLAMRTIALLDHPTPLPSSGPRRTLGGCTAAFDCRVVGRSRRVPSGRAAGPGTLAGGHPAISFVSGGAGSQGRAGPPSPPRDPAARPAASHSPAGRPPSRLVTRRLNPPRQSSPGR